MHISITVSVLYLIGIVEAASVTLATSGLVTIAVTLTVVYKDG